MAVKLPEVPIETLINNMELSETAKRLYGELVFVKDQPAPAAIALLAGGVLEALLLDRLLEREAEALRAFEAARGKPAWDALESWPLGDLLEVAARMGLVGPEQAELGETLRDFRRHLAPSEALTRPVRLVNLKEAHRLLKVLVRVVEEMAELKD